MLSSVVYLLWSIEESREWSEKFINLHFTNCGITDCDDFIMSEVKFGVLYIHTYMQVHTYLHISGATHTKQNSIF